MIVDLFSHIVPKGYLSLLGGLDTPYTVKASGNGKYHLKAWRPYTFDEDSYWTTAEPRLELMKKYGIDFQVLILGTPALDRSGKEAGKLAIAANDSLAKIAEENPRKFCGVAEVPLYDVREGLTELRRAVTCLGLKGVQLLSTIDGVPLDDPRFGPIFEEIETLGIPVWLHPSPRDGLPAAYEVYNLDVALDWPYETTVAALRLMLSGFLDRFPELKFVVHHSGAMMPFFYQRILSTIENDLAHGSVKLARVPEEYFSYFYFDTAVHSAPSLECTYGVFGPDRICVGTDFPYGPEGGERYLRRGVECVWKAKIPDEAKKKILYENAVRLLKL